MTTDTNQTEVQPTEIAKPMSRSDRRIKAMQERVKTVNAKRVNHANIMEVARKSGKSPAAIYWHLRRGGTIEEALIDQTKKERTYRNQELLEEVYQFVLDYAKLNRGYTPSLPQICEGLEITSTGKANYIVLILREQGRLRTSPGGHLIIPGSRFYDPDRNALVGRLVELAGQVKGEKYAELREVAQMLGEDTEAEIEPDDLPHGVGKDIGDIE